MWLPILDGELSEAAKPAVGAIASALSGDVPPPYGTPPSSLADGYAGIAVTLAYLDDADAAAAQLDRAVEALGTHEVDASLHWGLSGTGWALAHLDPDADLADIDDVVRGFLANAGGAAPIGLMEGVAGIGLYGLEHLPAPGARDIVSLAVGELDRMAEPLEPGIGWLSAPRWIGADAEDYPDGYYSLGVAHGIPGAIPLLAGACVWEIEQDRARRLLDGAVTWLMAQRLADRDDSVFPYVVAPGSEPRPARAAWCYGDPGIAAVLAAAGLAIGRSDWIEQARLIGLACGQREPEAAMVRDAGLCHGAAGLGHILNRLFQATGDEELRELARRWLALAIELGSERDGIDGYKTVNRHDPEGRTLFPGILSGPAGVALALHAARGSDAPDWDRMLGLSVRTPE